MVWQKLYLYKRLCPCDPLGSTPEILLVVIHPGIRGIRMTNGISPAQRIRAFPKIFYYPLLYTFCEEPHQTS